MQAAAGAALTAPALLAKAGRSELARHDGLGLAELIRKKEITPSELVDEVARRIDRVNGQINAVLTKNFDLDRARDRAKMLAPFGPLGGVPVMLKNLVPYNGGRMDSSSRLNAKRIAQKGLLVEKNSPLVEALENAGMVITGLTNAPEFGLIDTTEPLLHGPTRNPWNPARTSGGSSGGSAAAVAAGIVPLAHGNDGGGSIRIPACQCGVFGLKPTRGRELGNDPSAAPAGNSNLNISSDLCLSRSVRDTAAFLSIVEKQDDRALRPVGFVKEPSKKRLKIGLYLESLRGQQPHPEVANAIQSTAKLCEGLGHRVEPMKLDINEAEFWDTFIGFWSTFTLGEETNLKQWFGDSAKPEDYLEPWTLGLLETAKRRGPRQCVERAAVVFAKLSAHFEQLYANFDVLLSPVMTNPPYEIGYHAPTVPFETLLPRVLDDCGYTPIYNAIGATAMSVPLTWSRDGLPIGSQFSAWRGGEGALLGLAYELEAARPWAKRHPKIYAA